ncbi:MAG: hypothetical protein FJ308_10155 [Planctomycetes bacterium]|nr:hypothetical protein [Planctomycetota bacterium]
MRVEQLPQILDFTQRLYASLLTPLQTATVSRFCWFSLCTMVAALLTAHASCAQEIVISEAPAGSSPMVVLQGDELPPGAVPLSSLPPNSEENKPSPPSSAPSADSKKENAPQAVETMKRPKEPKAPPNKAEFQVHPDEAGMVQFQFRDQSWPDVL